MPWCSRSSRRRRLPRKAPRRAAPALKRIVETREYRGAIGSVSDVDETDDLRPHEAAEADAADEGQVVDRYGTRRGKYLPRVDERRDLELGGDVEQLAAHGER